MAAAKTSIAAPVIAATFTVEPVLEAIDFWRRKLVLPDGAIAVPYGQLLADGLNPQGLLAQHAGPRVVLVRLSDIGNDRDVLYSVLSNVGQEKPLALLLCPEADGSMPDIEAWPDGVEAINVAELMTAYGVDQVADPMADEAGHVPYTPEAMAVLGTGIARWLDRLRRPPLKMIAVDADQTLWRGVLGEDGANGVRLSPQDSALQSTLRENAAQGRILSLCTKNDRSDIDDIFRQRTDFALRSDDFLDIRADWQAKPDNLAEGLSRFGVGQDAVLFLDDNPVEIAAMRAALPGVMSVTVPEGEPAFARHVWPLDPVPVTEEDERRTDRYRQETKRQAAMTAAPSLSDFFETLELDIIIEPAMATDCPRIAQLTERTNQFNASLIRCSEADISSRQASNTDFLYTVTVRDRFGDYGLVGVVGGRAKQDSFLCDLFLLSCRALGRGVEHQMLTLLGQCAADAGLNEIVIVAVEGPRNTPVRRFLAAWSNSSAEDQYSLSQEMALDCRFEPGQAVPVTDMSAPIYEGGAPPDIYDWIANEMTTGHAIVEAMAAAYRPRPTFQHGYVAPGPGAMSVVTAIWEDVLRIRPIGVRDSFTELGGRSIQLLQVQAGLVKWLGRPVEITSLFRYSTVEELVNALTQGGHPEQPASHRAERVRQSTSRLAARRRTLREVS
ncbi:HAD-IIIC family phosphatase [Parvularcula sp. LCG005]|uniref:HAD-IIIC family phosphatase n=1 Tax=Parvularcula sp. LCG005 TaxID=3078805 RepID=UPI0029421C4F|nr:HAD-IIIC family phosphatase [Parvularcula sp. LCG005]WOI51993.1 HAD-IIIC family phosphatase [Parvularcula sp. LCG005]